LGLDNRDIMVFLIEIENHFGIEISQEEELGIKTIYDLLTVIQGKL
jgi:acyl carrier protein